MSARDDGGLAFPIASDVIGHIGGMSLRDYFAAHADVRSFRPPEKDVERLFGIPPPADDEGAVSDWLIRVNARMRYALADAMLEARKGGE